MTKSGESRRDTIPDDDERPSAPFVPTSNVPLRTRYDHNDDWAEATITATNRDGTFDLEVENVGIVENVSKVRRTKKEFVATFTQ